MKPSHPNISDKLHSLLNEAIIPCTLNDAQLCKPLAELVGEARIVLLGEATHGTAEFYEARALLSEYLIREKGFQAIAVEADWTSAYPVHRYLQGESDDAASALFGFQRFPLWMWRNTVILQLIKRLRRYRAGFYGLDLYCLTESMQAVIDYLAQQHPKAAAEAQKRYACFDHAAVDPQVYGYLVEQQLKEPCVKAVTEQLLDVQRLSYQQIKAGLHTSDERFYSEQNARLVKNAENYYRALFETHEVTWNIRDRHMADTLQNIMTHLENKSGKPAKIIVWAHNSHLGDARATEMAERGEINLGQLVRERFNAASFSLGFLTAKGSVLAASNWNGEARVKSIRTPIDGSYEKLFHLLDEKKFILDLRPDTHLNKLLKMPQLERAIGVIYRPDAERVSHYFLSRLPYQFDAVVYLDVTHALTSLDQQQTQAETGLPETYPEGL